MSFWHLVPACSDASACSLVDLRSLICYVGVAKAANTECHFGISSLLVQMRLPAVWQSEITRLPHGCCRGRPHRVSFRHLVPACQMRLPAVWQSEITRLPRGCCRGRPHRVLFRHLVPASSDTSACSLVDLRSLICNVGVAPAARRDCLYGVSSLFTSFAGGQKTFFSFSFFFLFSFFFFLFSFFFFLFVFFFCFVFFCLYE